MVDISANSFASGSASDGEEAAELPVKRLSRRLRREMR
jgi:hypothetical protein